MVLDELMSLGERLALNRVGDHQTSICLSGSTVMLKDVMRVGDIDFCEYIPAVVPPGSVAEAFRDQVEGTDPRHYRRHPNENLRARSRRTQIRQGQG